MIYLTLTQAAERVGREKRTIRRWVSSGHLPATVLPNAVEWGYRHGEKVVELEDLLACEQAHRRHNPATKRIVVT